MARKKNTERQVTVKSPVKTREAGTSLQQASIFLWIAIISTMVIYLPSLFNDFIYNWDDGGYITEYPIIQKINAENIATIFTTFYKGNYHPLTTLVNALEYAVAGDSPFLYHLVNLVLHLLNVWLVYRLLQLLINNPIASGLAALLFGIHPMHVESVAWISELKDVLYSFFYLFSLILYIRYAKGRTSDRRLYLLSIGSFLLSLLSKSTAVTLPVILLLTDWFIGRKISYKLLIEKLPFFLLSIAFGIIAILSQSERGAIQDLAPLFTIPERLLIASYALMQYVIKLFAPISLSAMYPYPDRIDGMLPPLYFIAPLVIIVLAVIIYLWGRKHRIAWFGSLFFLVASSLTLQLLPVGGAILAERYTYIPYLGFFAMAGFAFANVEERKIRVGGQVRTLVRIIVICYLGFLAVLTYQRIGIWKNGIELFTDVIDKYPNLPFAYNNRGYAYQKYFKDPDAALADYSSALSLDSTYHQPYSNRGVVYHNLGKYDLAVADFDKAIRYKPDNTDALIGRANSLSTLGRYADAIPSYDQYLLLVRDHAKAYLWRGVAYYHTGNYAGSAADIDQSIALDATDAESYHWKGLAVMQLGDTLEALECLSKSIELNPAKADSYSWRGLLEHERGNLDNAVADLSAAISRNPGDQAAFINRAVCYNDLGRYAEAYNDLVQAAKLGYPVNPAFMERVRLAAGY